MPKKCMHKLSKTRLRKKDKPKTKRSKDRQMGTKSSLQIQNKNDNSPFSVYMPVICMLRNMALMSITRWNGLFLSKSKTSNTKTLFHVKLSDSKFFLFGLTPIVKLV